MGRAMRPNRPVPRHRTAADADPPRDAARPGAPGWLDSLPHQTYRFRMLGMALGGLPVLVVLSEIGAAWPAWTWLAFSSLIWPHLAFFLARTSRDPYRAERRNLTFDSVIAGAMVPLMHFNLLPSVTLLTVATSDKISTGIRHLWLRTVPLMIAALLVAGTLTGFAWRPETSMPVLLATLPILVIHTIAVSLNGYWLIRKVQKQNQRLDELHRTDALTGLESRAHWETQAEAALARYRTQAQPVTLLLVDLDKLKHINDRHGHAIGDDVLRAIAGAIRRNTPEHGHAGRLGGDEFAVLLPLARDEADIVAERMRADVEALDFPHVPGLRASISLGLAEPPAAGLGLREWSETADRAMYRNKHAARSATDTPERGTERHPAGTADLFADGFEPE